MIKYIPKPIPITTEDEKTLKRLAHEEYEKQKKNPTEVFWWLHDDEHRGYKSKTQ